MPAAPQRALLLLAGLQLVACNIVSVPDPLAGTGYPSEHGNYLCERRFGRGAYPLPCRAPREEWDDYFADKFVITAWWPPTMNQVRAGAKHASHSKRSVAFIS